MFTTIHSMPEPSIQRNRLRTMAYDTKLDPRFRQKAAAMLLTSNIPGMVSDIEVKQFFQAVTAEIESKLL